MGFPFGNALAAIKDENVRACFMRLGAAVHENQGTTSTLIRESSAQSGTGFELSADHDADIVTVNAAIAAVIASIPAAANPTGTIGVAAVNGSATTFMRSDAAPAFDMTIARNWTAGVHTFTVQDVHNAGVSLGTSGSLTRASLAGTAAVPNLTFTASWSSNANTAGDIGYLFKPDNTMGATASIFQVQNSAARQLFDLRSLGGSGASNTQFRVGYDSSNYLNTAVTSLGVVNISAVGTSPGLTYSAGTGSMVFTGVNQTFASTSSAGVFTFSTGLSMKFPDGLVMSNTANTVGLQVGGDTDKIGFGGASGTTSLYGATFNVLFYDNEIVSYDDDMVTY